MGARSLKATAAGAPPGAAASLLAPTPTPQPPVHELSAATADARPAVSPAQDLQARLHLAYEREPQAVRWPMAVRLAIILGASAGLWTTLAWGAMRLFMR